MQGGKVLARRKKEGGRKESARGRVAGWEGGRMEGGREREGGKEVEREKGWEGGILS